MGIQLLELSLSWLKTSPGLLLPSGPHFNLPFSLLIEMVSHSDGCFKTLGVRNLDPFLVAG